MREYSEKVRLQAPSGEGADATLRVIRLPTHWYACLYHSDDLYLGLYADRSRFADVVHKFSDEEFLLWVRQSFAGEQGIEFAFKRRAIELAGLRPAAPEQEALARRLQPQWSPPDDRKTN